MFKVKIGLILFERRRLIEKNSVPVLCAILCFNYFRKFEEVSDSKNLNVIGSDHALWRNWRFVPKTWNY